MDLGIAAKDKRMVHILCTIYDYTENPINVNNRYCCLNTVEDAANTWGVILEKYAICGSQLPRRLKWRCSEALVTYCV